MRRDNLGKKKCAEIIRDKIKDFVPHLAWTLQAEEDYPKTAVLLRQLRLVNRSANFLLQVVHDFRLRALLDEVDEGPLDAHSVVACLSELQARSAKLLKENPGQKGQRKLLPSSAEGPDARAYCALLVASCWRSVVGRWPGKNDADAYSACEHLWLAAGGAPHGGVAAESGALTAWRRHLARAAKHRAPQPAGALVEKMLERSEPVARKTKMPAAFYDHSASKAAQARGTKKA